MLRWSIGVGDRLVVLEHGDLFDGVIDRCFLYRVGYTELVIVGLVEFFQAISGMFCEGLVGKGVGLVLE